MDFSPTEAQADLAALTRRILADQVTQERLRKLEDGPDRFDPALWSVLADAGVLAAALPESVGGSGFGPLEQCTVLVELGRTVAPVPYLPSIVLAAAALAEFGDERQRDRWVLPAAQGRLVLTAALEGSVSAAPGERGGWVLNGTAVAVPAGPIADLILVPADTPDGRATVGLCAFQLGVTERALELTAEYARGRVQFGRPIGGFQAVAQRLADAYVDVEAIRLTLWQAAWRLSTGQAADAELATAKFWAADAGHRVAHTAVHVHGGVGIDTDHPLHRYFVAAKRAEFALGGATEQLLRLGKLLAAEQPS
jgi:acyl-CoA dehydrogenase